jgi:four helix bundle protein
MPKIQTYKELVVWHRSMQSVSETYKIVRQLPKFELYILGSQMTRCAISIPANIAEGWARNYRAEFMRFLSISYGSAQGLETHLLICQKEYSNLNYNQAFILLTEVEKMLSTFIIKLKTRQLTD